MLVSIGTPPWTKEALIDSLDEFVELYEKRPINYNEGGMRAGHMFALWSIARNLDPDIIVESGVFKGQSTWLLENACPNATLYSIDINLAFRVYISEKAQYSNLDFSEHNWASVPITDRSLVFLDDHQNSYTRLQQCKWFGFKNVIYEDNYPSHQGDCYSIKKIFEHSGFVHPQLGTNIPNEMTVQVNTPSGPATIPVTINDTYKNVAPNEQQAALLKKNLEIYSEFPPVVKGDKTFWNDTWDDKYATTEPLFATKEDVPEKYKVFVDDADMYCWLCYLRLN